MALEFGYWAPNLGTSLVASRISNRTGGDFAANLRYARLAEQHGFAYTLLATRFVSSLEGNEGTYDSIVMAGALAAGTERIVPISAVATGLAHPAIVAKQLITLDEISQGRAAINIVSGWLKDEYLSLGQHWLDHDERYRRSEEFITVLRALWSDAPRVKHAGFFYRLDDVDFRPKPLRAGGIPIFQGGNSTAARQMAGRLSDFYFMNGAPLPSLVEHMASVDAYAAQAGRRLRHAVNAFVIVRDTTEQAYDVLREIIANADEDVVARFARNVRQAGQATPDRQGMWADSRPEDLIQFNDGFRTGLIGTAHEVASRIVDLEQAGVDMLLAGFLHYDDELAAFGQTVIPRVRALSAQRAAQAAPVLAAR
ncbi:Coenzyme F420-dependent N5,N10-methylene tetrahydromethanopterin reductase and related flavin-dependent oxidoreductases; sulfonate monooxygenase [plant metagenome]